MPSGSESPSLSDTVEVSFQIACPCGQVLTVGPTMVGQAVRCPRCAVLLEVPSPDESAVTTSPGSTMPHSDGPWRTSVGPFRADSFVADELRRDAEKQPGVMPEKRDSIDPTPLVAILGGTILVLLFVGLGFYTLDRYIDDFKHKAGNSFKVESKEPADTGSEKGSKSK